MHLRAKTKHKGWFKRCVKGVKASGSAGDPQAVCGAVLKRKRAKNAKHAEVLSGATFHRAPTERGAKTQAAVYSGSGHRTKVAQHNGKWGCWVWPKKANPERLPAKFWRKQGKAAGEQEGKAVAVGLKGQDEPSRFRFMWDRAISNGEALASQRDMMSRAFAAGFRPAYQSARMKRNPAWMKMADGRTKAQAEELATKLKREDRKLRALGSTGNYSAIEVRQTFDGPKGKEYGVFVVMREANSKKRNPESGAVAMREKFTGLPAESTVVVARDEHVHGHLAALGELVELRGKTITGQPFIIEFTRATNPRRKAKDIISKVGKHTRGWLDRRAKALAGLTKGFSNTWINPRKLNPGGPVLLCSNESGSHLFIEGGDQSLDLSKVGLGDQAKKETCIVGPVHYVTYHTRKKFDGKEEEYDYEHEFSEDSGGPRPSLRYDVKNKHLYLDGGVYYVPKPLLGTSQGITD